MMDIETFSSNLPNDLKTHLDMIAKKLAENRASLMVGAGFSRNTNPDAPLWDDLRVKLEHSLYSAKTKGYSGKPTGKGVLQLAEEYETIHSPTELWNFVRDNIDDNSFIPGELHQKLLSLPWRDIFTTNYDTLLEKAYQSILTERRYSIVTREDQLTNCESDVARIIKLHGSLPNDTPFILTEEHYRRYPEDHAIFVNTVQQSLIENSLCLIGFSGTDPNFIKWTGWIRDNLSNSANPVYLIDCCQFSMAERETLKKKNIVVVSLNDHPEIQKISNIEQRYKEAFGCLFEYLGIPASQTDKIRDWPLDNKFFTPSENINIHELMHHWECQRKTYPNWLILPYKHRKMLSIYTQQHLKVLNDAKLDAPNDLNYGYELFWRNKKCLFPLFSEFSGTLEKILLQYNPFPEENSLSDATYTPVSGNGKAFNWPEIEKKWIEIVFAFIQDARFEMREVDFFNWMNNVLNEKIVVKKPEWEARWHYEKCLFAIAQFDISSLENAYNRWPQHKDQYAEQLWRAGILCELGKIKEAETILEAALTSLRKQTNQTLITNDFYLIDIENYLLCLLMLIKDSIWDIFPSIPQDTTDKSSKSKLQWDRAESNSSNQNVPLTSEKEEADRKSKQQEEELHNKRKQQQEEKERIRKIYDRRWKQLKQYDCYVWDEMAYFEDNLNTGFKPQNSKTSEVEFFTSEINYTNHISAHFKEYEAALSWPIFFDETGIPLKIGSYTLINSGKIINASSWLIRDKLHQAILLCVRLGAEKTENFFSKIEIARMAQSDLDDLLNLYIKATRNAILQLPENPADSTSYAINICRVLPTVISRLCIAASTEIREKLMLLAVRIYNLPSDQIMRIFQHGSRNLWEGILNERNDYEIAEYIAKTIKLPVFNDNNWLLSRYQPDPILLVDHILDASETEKLKRRIAGDILIVFESLKDEATAKAAIKRLIHLARLKLLDEKSKRAFSKYLWHKIDHGNGLPSILSEWNKDIVLDLPAPNKNIKPSIKFKVFLLSKDFPLRYEKNYNQSFSVNNESFSCIGEYYLYARKLLQLCTIDPLNMSRSQLDLTYEDAIGILNKAICCWERDKELLKKPIGDFVDIANEFRKRFMNYPRLLAEVIIPIIKDNISDIDRSNLKRLLEEMEQYEIPCALPLVSGLMIFPENLEAVKKSVLLEICSRDFKTVNFAYMSVTEWLILNKSGCLNMTCPQEIIDLFINLLLLKNPVCRESLIMEITRIISKKLTKLNIEQICIGLKYLLIDTDFSGDDCAKSNDTEYERRPYFRALAAGLAYEIYKQLKSAKKPIKPVLLEWKKVCQSSILPEIKNKWKR